MSSAIPEDGPSADFQKFCFHAANRSDMVCVELLIVRNGISVFESFR